MPSADEPIQFDAQIKPLFRLPELLGDVLQNRIQPGRVFDYETELDGIPGAYAAMDERRAIKALIRI